jgi:hypothetical protein
LTDCATASGAVAVQRQPPVTGAALGLSQMQSRQSELHHKIATLERRQGNLVEAMKSGCEPLIDHAVRILEGALTEAMAALKATAQLFCHMNFCKETKFLLT